MRWLPCLPWLRLAWLQVWRLRGVRRLLRALGTVPHLLSSATCRLIDHRPDHPCETRAVAAYRRVAA